MASIGRLKPPQCIPPHQRRLRNVHRIVARNVFCSDLGPRLLDLQLTLHRAQSASEFESAPFFQSEVVYSTTNPEWHPLDLSYLERHVNIAISTFVARVWHLDSSTMRRILLIEWFVDLRCLSHIDPERRLPTDLNELCFVSQDNIYYVRPTATTPAVASDVAADVFADLKPTTSYALPALLSLVSATTALAQANDLLEQTRFQIDKRLLLTRQPLMKAQQRSALQLRVSYLEGEVAALRAANEAKSKKVQEEKISTNARQSTLLASCDTLRSITEQLIRRVEVVHTNRVVLRKTEELLHERRKELIHTMVSIFTLHNSPGEDTSDELTIIRCHLPNDLNGDEEEISAALGYVAFALAFLSHYYDVPLRYPPQPMGSRSTIRDDVTAVYPTHEYPLYFKGQDSKYARYAFLLLRCDMEQLLQSRGIKAQQGRLLHNLQRFIFNETGATPDSKRSSLGMSGAGGQGTSGLLSGGGMGVGAAIRSSASAASSSLTSALQAAAAMSPKAKTHTRKTSGS